jgi:hypothetical protein
VLTLGETPDSDAALFTVYDGQLTLEGLELLLRPVNPKLAALCAVRMVGDGSCVLKNCVVTLQDARRVPLCVATVASDPGAGMREKIEPKAARTADQPRLRMQDCFLRGEGDGVLARVSRPFQLDVTNCLAALSGSFLNIDASREETVPPPGQEISVRLTRLTAYLGGHLVHLHAGKDMKTLVPVNCAAVRVTLVHLDGPETSDEKMKTQVVWSGSRNTYSNYPAMLDQQQTDSEMSMPLAKFTQEKWKTFTGENDAAFTRVRFTDPPLVESLGRAVPGNFKLLQSEGPRSGADVGLLPKPAPEEGSSVPR